MSNPITTGFIADAGLAGRNPGRWTTYTAYVSALLVLFLQSGYSYYISVQTLAFAVILGLALSNGLKIRNFLLLFTLHFIFSGFLITTAYTFPEAISRNSPNIAITALGVSVYAFIFLVLANISFASPKSVIAFFRALSKNLLVIFFLLILIMDLGLVPGLTRDFFINQNEGLVTNFSSAEMLEPYFRMLERLEISAPIDLFYGEQSYLAIIIFTALVSLLMCNLVLQSIGREVVEDSSLNGRKKMPFRFSAGDRITIVCGIGTLLYVQSFSGLIYAIIILFSLIFRGHSGLLSIGVGLKNFMALFCVTLSFLILMYFSFDYYAQRIFSISESISLAQRFLSFAEFSAVDYLVGVKNIAVMPELGFHNGILHIIAMSGFGGILFMLFFFGRAFFLSRRFGLQMTVTLCLLAIFSQNGAIFSPNKIVILSFILFPLACAATTSISDRNRHAL